MPPPVHESMYRHTNSTCTPSERHVVYATASSKQIHSMCCVHTKRYVQCALAEACVTDHMPPPVLKTCTITQTQRHTKWAHVLYTAMHWNPTHVVYGIYQACGMCYIPPGPQRGLIDLLAATLRRPQPSARTSSGTGGQNMMWGTCLSCAGRCCVSAWARCGTTVPHRAAAGARGGLLGMWQAPDNIRSTLKCVCETWWTVEATVPCHKPAARVGSARGWHDKTQV
jgi:hypothetical protein